MNPDLVTFGRNGQDSNLALPISNLTIHMEMVRIKM